MFIVIFGNPGDRKKINGHREAIPLTNVKKVKKTLKRNFSHFKC